ncbi:hypothetical protein NFI96_027822, partial [Prochilodus magdalenae]
FDKPIPVSAITSYQEKTAGCQKPGVIFTLRKRGEVCVDPALKWVKRALRIIDSRLLERTTDPKRHKTKDIAFTVTKALRPDPTTVHECETETQTPPAQKTLRPDPALVLHEHRTENPTPSAQKTLRADPALVPHKHGTENRTPPAQKTLRADQTEPTWFCQI